MGKIFGYLYELVARKEVEPDDALISRLVHEYLPTGELARETIAMNSFILLNAGHETSANMIGLGTLALLENPDVLAKLRDTDDTKVVSGAVEELLRYLTVAHNLVARVAKEDIEIGGTLARAELEIALPTLLRRLPNLRLAVPFDEVRFRDDMNIYGVHELQVEWS
jgi:cytochrome P450